MVTVESHLQLILSIQLGPKAFKVCVCVHNVHVGTHVCVWQKLVFMTRGYWMDFSFQ